MKVQALSAAALATEQRTAERYARARAAAVQRGEEEQALAEEHARRIEAAEAAAAARLASLSADLDAARAVLCAREARTEADEVASAEALADQAEQLRAAKSLEAQAAGEILRLRAAEMNALEAAAAREVSGAYSSGCMCLHNCNQLCIYL